MNRRNLFNPINLGLIALVVGAVISGVHYLTTPRQSEPTPLNAPTPTDFPSLLPTAPLALPSPTPSVQGSLIIPSANVYAPIIEAYLDGTSWGISHLGDNAGHLEGTAWLDQPGNIVLAGHVERANGRPGIFAALGSLKPGDWAMIKYGGEERMYTISLVGVYAPNDLTPLYPSSSDRLTLITCDKYDFVTNSYRERIVAIADRVT